MSKYQWEINYKQTKPKRKIADFVPNYGWSVLERDESGLVKKLRLQVYAHRAEANIFLIGEFNDWGRLEDLEPWRLQNQRNGFFAIEANGEIIKHKSEYLLLVEGTKLRDPAAVYFNSNGRCVFWDFDHPTSYQMQYTQPDRVNNSIRVLQTDLYGLVCHFADQQGVLGKEIPTTDIYKFIAESGVITRVAELGFNAVQFLPFNQSIDGAKWSFRYLIPFVNAINNAWGNPDDFAKMVDEFHKHGISIISDFVISHVPTQDYKIFGLSEAEAGIHHWIGDYGEEIWLGEETSWGTRRYNFGNEMVRRFITEAALSMLKHYKVDGFRIDNVDGILRHGKNGDGVDRTGGREMLRELNKSIYEYDPHSMIHLESHYFKGNEAKYLTLPLGADRRAIGATAYTSSRITHYFHKDYMPKSADQISPWNIKQIIEEKEWGQSNSTIADFHNHDAAAGLMHGRATGSYAYDALILGDPNLHEHAIGKIKVMEAIISFGLEGRTLDLLQTHLLQTGTFEHDSTIHWFLEMNEQNRSAQDFKKSINEVMSNAAFAPQNTKYSVYANVDEKQKSLVIHRSNSATQKGEHFIIYINMSSAQIRDYVIPVKYSGTYTTVLNSANNDTLESIHSQKVDLFEHYSHGLRINQIAGYQILVFKL